MVGVSKQVTLARRAGRQIVVIPDECEFSEDKVVLRREGNCLTICPIKTPSLLAVLESLSPIEDDFAPISD